MAKKNNKQPIQQDFDEDGILDGDIPKKPWESASDLIGIDRLSEDIEDIVNGLIPSAKTGDKEALQRLIALADLRGNARVIIPVLFIKNGDIEKVLGNRSQEIDDFIIAFCMASIGTWRGGRRELLVGICQGDVNLPLPMFEGAEKKRGLLSRIFGR